jgi:uncharacterized membrane protein
VINKNYLKREETVLLWLWMFSVVVMNVESDSGSRSLLGYTSSFLGNTMIMDFDTLRLL